MVELYHPNTIHIKDVLQDVDYHRLDGTKTKETCMVLELAPHGELLNFVSSTPRFSEETCRYIFLKILNTLKHFQDNGYAHRDLKPENIFIGKNFKIKLADFGFSKTFLSKTGFKKLWTKCGTSGYMAPEIELRMAYDGRSTDLFAATVILF